MYVIAVSNPKGGCGKTTITLNLGVFLLLHGVNVQLVDLDEQHSLSDWIRARPKALPELTVHSVSTVEANAYMNDQRKQNGDHVLLLDYPAGVSKQHTSELLGFSDMLLIPALPSPVDMRALFHHLFTLAQQHGDHLTQSTQIAMVANRVKANTRMYLRMKESLQRLQFPLVGTLRDTQNYSLAAANGIGVAELPQYRIRKDLAAWQPLLSWVFSNIGHYRG